MGFRTATLATLGALAAALLAPIVLLSLRPAAPGAPRLVPAGADVTALELRFEAPVRLERVARSAGGDLWRIVGPDGGPADPGVVDAMLAALETARPKRAIRLDDPAEPPAAMGLAPPRGTVRLWSADGTTWVVEFGAPPSEEPGLLHVRSSLEPGLVWVAADSLRRSLARTPADLRDRRLWSSPSARVQAVEWRDGTTVVRVERTADGFRVTPPGTLADPERAARLFDLAAAPRASAFPGTDACAAPAGPRLIVEESGGRHELAFAGEDGAAGRTLACVDGRTTAAVATDLLETPRSLAPLLARAPLFGTLDPDAVTSIAVEEPEARWTLRRGPEGWEAEGLGFVVEPAAVGTWLRRLSLVVVEPERLEVGPFAAAGTVEVSSRRGSPIRIERSAAAADGTVLVRRAGESAAFRLAPETSYLLASPQAHLAGAGTACDPLAAARVEVREAGADAAGGRPVQTLERAPEGGWRFAGSSWPVDAAAVDLLLGELCRLPLQSRIGVAAFEEARWTARVVDREGRELVLAGILDRRPGRDAAAAVLSGESDARALSEAGWGRLTRPMVAAEALQLRPSAGASLVAERGDGRRLALAWDGAAWTSPRLPAGVASSAGSALSSPAWRAALSLAGPDESAGWRMRWRVERRASGGAPAQEWRIGGPDAEGRLLLQDVATGASFEIDPGLPGLLELAMRLATE